MEIEKKEPKCPKCGATRITARWVKKTQPVKVVPITMEEHAKQLIENFGRIQSVMGDIAMPISWHALASYAQVVLTCESCGFTKTFEIPETVFERAEVIIPINALQVWCRNGDVAKDATPCASLKCPFKKEKSNIVAGIAKCGKNNYALTFYSTTWQNAIQLPEETKIIFLS